MAICEGTSDSDNVFISVKMVLQEYFEALICRCKKCTLKMAIQLLKLYFEGVIYRCENDENTPMIGGFYQKDAENVL